MADSSEKKIEGAFEKLAHSAVQEHRRKRRWGIFFKLIAVLYIGIFLVMLLPNKTKDTVKLSPEHSSLVDIKGPISHDEDASADKVVKNLHKAFKAKNSKGVILRINSPGGSPVQASYIFNELRRLKVLHPETKVIAVCTDLCASAAYYIAAGADEIYANPSSMVGSIGVVLSSFGFVDAINKLGVKRRLYTAGKYKGFLDPFTPIVPYQKNHLENMLTEVHQQFINSVKTGRGDKLKDNPEIYSGLIWTGEGARKLGLIDGFASPGQVAREILKAPRIIKYSDKSEFARKLMKYLRSEVLSPLLNSGQILNYN